MATNPTDTQASAARARAAIATLAPERTIPPLVALYQQAIAMRSRR